MPGDFDPRQIDFRSLALLPEQYAQGQQTARENVLRKAFSSGQFTAPDGTLDYAKMFQAAAQAGMPEFAMQAAQLQAEQAYRGEMMKPQLQRDWEFLSRSQGGAGPTQAPTMAGATSPPTAPATTGGTKPLTPIDLYKAQHPKLGVSPGTQAMDATFGKDFELWNRGGKAESSAGLANLRGAIKLLETKQDKVSGPIVGGLIKNDPEGKSKWAIAARAYGIPGVASAQDVQDAYNIVQSHQRAVMVSLRPIMGARFAQDLAKMVINATLDISQPWSTNVKRLKILDKNLTESQKAMDDMGRYFSSNDNSLSGYTGTIPDIGDFMKGLDDEGTAGTSPAAGDIPVHKVQTTTVPPPVTTDEPPIPANINQSELQQTRQQRRDLGSMAVGAQLRDPKTGDTVTKRADGHWYDTKTGERMD